MRKFLLAIGISALLATSATAQTRFPEMAPGAMSADQKSMYDAIMAGPRHSMEGPFNAWLRSPVLGTRLQAVGEYLRFSTTVPHKLNEFAILITAVEWSSGFEWYAHHPLALKAGLEPEVAEQLRKGKRPTTMTPDEATVYDFVTQLHRQHQVGNKNFGDATALLGEQGVMDLVALVGYYDIVSMTLNVAQVQPPQGAGPTLAPPAMP
ncbi:MAG: carboxymuconolactone decarboxylase family protein [Janthinobacterium lividum]